MEDTLKRLLAAEQQATEITRAAEVEAEKILRDAQDEVHRRQNRYEERLPGLRSGHLQKATERAQQTMKEVEKRYGERIAGLRDAAEQNEEEALDAAFEQLLGTGKRTLS